MQRDLKTFVVFTLQNYYKNMKYYDVAIINKNGWFEIIQNVLALSKVDAMHIVEIKYGVTAKDAVISE